MESMVCKSNSCILKTVNYDQLIPVVIKGIQEQQEIIEALNERIEVFEIKIEGYP